MNAYYKLLKKNGVALGKEEEYQEAALLFFLIDVPRIAEVGIGSLRAEAIWVWK
jgi:hypothetical protein